MMESNNHRVEELRNDMEHAEELMFEEANSKYEPLDNIICVFGGKGGVGVTLLSLSLAYLISKYLNERVCLISSDIVIERGFRAGVLPKFKDVSGDVVSKLTGSTMVWATPPNPPISIMKKDKELLNPDVLRILALGSNSFSSYDYVIIDGENVEIAGKKFFVINQCRESMYAYENFKDEITTLIFSKTQGDVPDNLLDDLEPDIILPYCREITVWFNKDIWAFTNIVDKECEYLIKVAELINRSGIGNVPLVEYQIKNDENKKKKSGGILSGLLKKFLKR